MKFMIDERMRFRVRYVIAMVAIPIVVIAAV